MFSHSIKPIRRIDQFDITRIRQLSQSFGGVVVSSPPLNPVDEAEIFAFAQTPLPYTGKKFFSLTLFMNDNNLPNELQNIPNSLRQMVISDGKDLACLTELHPSRLNVHFNTRVTLDLNWHIDDIYKFWLFRQLPGDRRLEVFNPKESIEVINKGIDNILVTTRDLSDLVEQHPGRISQTSPWDRLFFTQHLAHKSGRQTQGMGYTIKPY